MNYLVSENGGKKYIDALGQACLCCQQDALDLVAACGENCIDSLLLHEGNLTPAFFNLKTGLAGEILQKFINYSIKVALVLDLQQVGEGRFKEMLIDNGRSRHFRVFSERNEAEQWLLELDSTVNPFLPNRA